MTERGDPKLKAEAGTGRPPDTEVRAELESILASKDFRASERRRSLLTYVVDSSLAGATDRLKGYTIATEVFGRDDDFDPQTDPIVRLETSRLRRDLELYYLSTGKDDPILISIPKGGNNPTFELRERVPIPDVSGSGASDVHVSTSSTTARRRWRWGSAAGLALTAAAVLAVAVILYVRATPDSMAPRSYDSVGVLPLDNFSGDPEQQYLAGGMTEAITHALGQIESLKVMSRTSMMRYRDEPKLASTIAQELSIAALVEGSVIRSGDRVRINVQLVDAKTDVQLWSRAFERPVGDILKLQNEVALAIANGIKVAIDPSELDRLTSSPSGNELAYEAYLKGRFLLRERTEASYRMAIRQFERAIGLEPEMAHAFAGLAEAYNLLRYEEAFPEGLLTRASDAAARAVELQPSLPDAHVALGHAMLQQYRWEQAEKAFLTALELEPNSSRTHLGYADYLNVVGRWDDALAELSAAQELDPLSLFIRIRLAQTYLMKGDTDFCVALVLEAQSLDPNHPMPYHGLGVVKLSRGEFQEAIELIGTGVELTGRSPWNLAVLGMAYGKSGRTSDALAIQKELMESTNDHHRIEIEMAITYIGLGDKEQALDWLEKAYEQHDAGIAEVRWVPLFDDVRDEPRFQALLERFNFPE